MEFFQYIPLTEAKELIDSKLDGVYAAPETVPLLDSLGRITAEDIAALTDMPPFDRSTVDGYAVRSDDTYGASEASPALFALAGEVAMGQPATAEIVSGQAMGITTGGMLPPGADAVVMFEHTEMLDANNLLVKDRIAPGENVVAQGEDLQADCAILAMGQKISPQDIGVLAACGCTHITVRKRLEVGIISTGDELVEVGQPVALGQIRDVNSFVLSAMLTELGCSVKRLGIVEDSYDRFYTTLREAVDTCQLVIISGGSSVGARDYTVKAIGALGQPGVLIHGVAVKPGRPTIFGMVDTTPVFGLPGHPMAAMTICEQLVKPAARKMMGQTPPDIISVPAILTRNVASSPGRDDFVNVRLSRQDGRYAATPILGKSGLIRVAAQADGMIHILTNQSGLYEGDPVDVLFIKNPR
ncbi:MAG TPA: gephyrin-like molybdotransferase Glp [Patescibacteria group bacterium]|nr:gephyrin-like molybdotransferase Glp [Patescibacteria group bacterium]